MNAELSKRIGSQDFLKGLQDFHDKSVKGNVTKTDGNNFSQLISSITKDAKGHQFNVTIDTKDVDNISKLLHQIDSFLKSKENFEKIAQTIPLPHVEQAVDNLTRYVDELQKRSKAVTEKERSGGLPHK